MPRSDPGAMLRRAFGGSSAEEAITRAVDRLLEQAGADGPPAPLDRLASLRGIETIARLPLAVSGFLVPLPEGGYVVHVNAAHSPGRQRFSIAHETCHTFFDEARSRVRRHEDAVTGAFDERRTEEYLCDLGAARMLLHPRWLRAEAVGRRPSLEGLLAIAAACDASAEATARQMAALGLWRCSFVIWEPGLRKAEEDLAGAMPLPGMTAGPVSRLRASRVYAPAGVPFLPRRKSTGNDSSIAAALVAEGETRGIERFEVGREVLVAECESRYVGYTDEAGREVPRVLTVMRWLPAERAPRR